MQIRILWKSYRVASLLLIFAWISIGIDAASDDNYANIVRRRKDILSNTDLSARRSDIYEEIAKSHMERNNDVKLLDDVFDGFPIEDGNLPREILEAIQTGGRNTIYSEEQVMEAVEQENGYKNRNISTFLDYAPHTGPFWEGEGEMDSKTFQWHLERLWEIFYKHTDSLEGDTRKTKPDFKPKDYYVEYRGMLMPPEQAKMAADFVKRIETKRMSSTDIAGEITNEAIHMAERSKEYAAWALFSKAYELDPKAPNAKSNLGVAYMRLRLVNKAYELLHEEFQRAPENDAILANFLENVKATKRQAAQEFAKKHRKSLADDNGKIHVKHEPVDFPRLTLSEMYQPENHIYLQGKRPFILTGVFKGEKLRELQRKTEAILAYFGDKTHIEYLPFASHVVKPMPKSITSLKRSIKLMEHTYGMPINDSRALTNRTHFGQNALWNPAWHEWYSMWNFLNLDNDNMPPLFRDDNHWLAPGACFPNMKTRGNFEDATRWRLIALGSQYGGMYLHADWLAVGSWQLQTLGTKTWFICARSEDPFIGDDDYVDGHSPNLEESPEFAVASCYNGTLYPGEYIYYPRGYWHQTMYKTQPSTKTTLEAPTSEEWTMPWNLSPLSLAISSTVLDPSSISEFFVQIDRECEKGEMGATETNFRIHPKQADFCNEVRSRCSEWIRQGTIGKWEGTASYEKNEDRDFYTSPLANGDYCTSKDTEEVKKELKRDISSYRLIHALTDDLYSTYDLLKEAYGEDIRYGE